MNGSRWAAALAGVTVPPDACNMYALPGPDGAVCRANLARYLDQAGAHAPTLLLVGEAPGYRGARLTGVPFTSEQLLVEAQVLGGGYRRAPGAGALRREATATMMWQALARLARPPLLWNVYPFHPYRPNHPASNRAPRSAEIDAGLPWLAALLDQFTDVRVLAVGHQAAAGLRRLGRPFTLLRHPSRGGKAAFAAGLTAALTRS